MLDCEIRTENPNPPTRIYFRDDRFTDETDANAYFAQNQLQVLATLKTPKTYQLTPTEITMLLGTNNIWADTGDILGGKYWGKNPVTITRAMLSTLRSAREITEITPEEPEEPEENDER